MRYFYLFRRLFGTLVTGILIVTPPSSIASNQVVVKGDPTCQRSQSIPNFLVFGGGGAPSYNEIALEKNVLYFQRTLKFLGYQPEKVASIFFANGNDGKATVRYIDKDKKQKFKPPEIPHLKGASTFNNLRTYIQQLGQNKNPQLSFFYFTGHGGENKRNLDNNSFYLWNNQEISVQEFTQMLDKIPSQKPVVMMMAQCFSGSFANFIYEGGNPQRPVALQTRCGFFATIKSLPSVGCTPEVNEADYRDYSSSFFAGLSGRDRTGTRVASADYNKDGKVSYIEAHAFAKVDEKTMDLPISTSESWLQRRSSKQQNAILNQRISDILKTSRPEQRYVVNSLMKTLNMDRQKSYLQNYKNISAKLKTDEQQAYAGRLGMELVNIITEKQVRTSNNKKDIAILERLLKCESGSWVK
jgi:hypothetical protein